MYPRKIAYVLVSVFWLINTGCAKKSTSPTGSDLNTYHPPAQGKILFMNFTMYSGKTGRADSVKLGKWEVVPGNMTPPLSPVIQENDLLIELMSNDNEVLETVRVNNPVHIHVEAYSLASGEHSRETTLDSATFFIRTVYKPGYKKVKVSEIGDGQDQPLLKTTIE